MNIQEALAAVRANPPHSASPLPWANDDEGALYCRSGYQLGRAKGHARHIRAAVNAAPVLAAEVERLQGLLAAARVAVEKWPVPVHTDACSGWRDPDMDFAGCDCGADVEDAARTKARRAVGE